MDQEKLLIKNFIKKSIFLILIIFSPIVFGQIQSAPVDRILKESAENNYSQNPPSEVIKRLIYLFNKGQLLTVSEEAQSLSTQFPKSFIIWNLFI